MTMMATVKISGPLFTGAMPARVEQAIGGAIGELLDAGKERLDEMLRPRPAGVYLSVQEAQPGKASVGDYRRAVRQQRIGMMGRLDDSKMTYGPWLEGVGSRNQTTRFKGYSSFRRTRDWLQTRARPVLAAHVAKLVQDIS